MGLYDFFVLKKPNNMKIKVLAITSENIIFME